MGLVVLSRSVRLDGSPSQAEGQHRQDELTDDGIFFELLQMRLDRLASGRQHGAGSPR